MTAAKPAGEERLLDTQGDSRSSGLESDGDGSWPRVRVLLPLPLAGAYDYLAPPELDLKPGDVVEAPIGRRRLHGVVWDPAPGAGGDDLPREKLKRVLARYEVSPLPEALRRFVDWVAAYTLSPPGAVLRMAVSVPSALEPARWTTAYRLGAPVENLGVKLTPARRRVLAVAAESPALPAADLARAAGVTPGVVKGLAEKGALEQVALPPAPPVQSPSAERHGPALSKAQDAAAADLREKVAAGAFGVTLLDGVTGSGKTEVYFEAVAEAIRQGRQALVLLPEIALSAQWLARFEERFGAAPAVWHSEVGQAERRRTWRAIAAGEVPVVVGARSALFLPYPDLGLIVVDEEHEGAFKQEDGVCYQARDMAVVRARLGQAPAVLVSATPSLETVTNVEAGRYGLLHLPERHGVAELPKVDLVDLRKSPPPRIESHGQSFISAPLREALAAALEAGEQGLLFLNRRGYAPLTLCRHCGHRMQCPNCTAWLVEHRLAARLTCHHCGYGQRRPDACPECGETGTLAACGPGVERLAEEVTLLFPEARVQLMTSDTMGGPAAAAAIVEAVQAREADIVIGTQIVAKGHHFPYLTVVGVVDADLGLSGGDLRAAERTYQLLHQVAGRAGREERPGRVLLQTFEPEHPVLQALAAGDRDRFLKVEAEQRRAAALPPFTRLAALILSGPDGRQVEAAAQSLAKAAPRGEEGIGVLGPAPAPLAVLRGRHRWRLLLRTRRDIAPQAVLRRWLAEVKLPSSVRLAVDIDPYSFL
jgi:primosomal protein N' (replication factor Y)